MEQLADGKLTVAISNGYPPFEYTDPTSGELTGFDVELAKAIGSELGVETVFESMEFEQMISSLHSKRVDIILSGMSDTEERRQTLDFVDYVEAGAQFFVPTDSGIDNLTEICGKNVASPNGTTYPDAVTKWSEENCPDDQQVNLVRSSDGPDLFIQLQTGRADAGYYGTGAVAFYRAERPGEFALVGDVLQAALYGIAIDNESDRFTELVVDALNTLRESGTYESLLEKYGMDSYALEEFTVNAG